MMQLKKIYELILQDIQEHPGSTQGQVITRIQNITRAGLIFRQILID